MPNAFQQFAQNVLRNYGSQITGMLGGSLKGTTFRLGDTGPGAVALTDAGSKTVTISRDWFHNASHHDRVGNLVYELSHVARGERAYNTNQDWSKRTETIIPEAVRLSLTGAAGINPDSLAAARKLAAQRGWLGGDMAGPGSNQTGTRATNTLRNNKARYVNGMPALGPAAVAGLSSQMQGLTTNLAGAMALQKASIGAAKGTFTLAQQQARAAELQGVQSAQADALDRGMLGSSQDLENRAGAVAGFAGAKNANIAARAQAIEQAKYAGNQAIGEYYTGVGQVQADAASKQAELAIAAYQNNTDSNYSNTLKHILRTLRRNGAPTGPNPNFPGNLTPWQGPSMNNGLYDRPTGGPT
jgi:hypothetical protein